MNARFKDESGKTFSRLTVVDLACGGRDGAFWNCICQCGNPAIVSGRLLRRGMTKSCGCFQREISSIINSTHKNARHGHISSEYRTWSSLKNRCNNPNDPAWLRYGGRGIRVSEVWNNSFEQFLSDMGKRPSSVYSLDRIDNDGNYSAENCRWATREQQMNNTRQNIILTAFGGSATKSQWARLLGVSSVCLIHRLEKRTLEQVIRRFGYAKLV